jgi:hypothetical protein
MFQFTNVDYAFVSTHTENVKKCNRRIKDFENASYSLLTKVDIPWRRAQQSINRRKISL